MLESLEKLNNIVQVEGYASKSRASDSLFSKVLQRAKTTEQATTDHEPEDVFIPRYSERSLEYAGMAQALQGVLSGFASTNKISLADARSSDRYFKTVIPTQSAKTA